MLPRSPAGKFLVALLVLSAGMVSAQSASAGSGPGYPNKPVRIVTVAPGGTPDLISRLISQGIAGSLGQPVIVDNRTGFIGIELVSRAAPDGYTLAVNGQNLWILPFLQPNISYDPMRDFAPIALVTRAPNVLVVHPSVPVKSVDELIALAKSRPGELNCGTGGPGSSNHLSFELFKAMTGVNMVLVNYKGMGPSITGLLGGEVQLMFAGLGPAAPHIKSGKLKALAVTTAQPSALTPGLPPLAKFLPGYDSAVLTGMFAPAGTSAAIIHRLNQEVVRLLDRADVKERLTNVGIEGIGSSPAEFAAIIKADMARMGKVIRDAGIRGVN
jgi:tripartite-type tricarboxylate transporter receptor subunit TctC